MNRRDFLLQMGIGAGAAAMLTCLSSCNQNNGIAPAASADFILDLNNVANKALLTRGGYIYQSGVIVAYTTKGAYVALSQVCTHQGYTVQYDTGSDTFYCPAHGSDFADNGSVNSGPAGVGLKSYTVTKTGNSLHVKG